MYYDINEIINKNASIGHHFFSPNALRFFSSRILPEIYYGKYFITSERNGFDDYSRSFTVRIATDRGEINTVGKFNAFKYKYQAVKFIKRCFRLEVLRHYRSWKGSIPHSGEVVSRYIDYLTSLFLTAKKSPVYFDGGYKTPIEIQWYINMADEIK